jgi:hypothetical protein
MSTLGRPMTPEEYAREWEAEAAVLSSRSDYSWMVRMLGDGKHVLEVGCGPGLSTIELAKRGKSVTVVEQNSHLLNMAETNLTTAGIPFVRINGNEKLSPPPPGNVLTISGSIADVSINPTLEQIGVDCIACWLIGAEPQVIGAGINMDAVAFVGREGAQYRWLVHRRCYQLGRSLLSPGQIVHLVDRCAIAGWDTKSIRRADHAEEHRAEAGRGFTITADNVFLRKIEGEFRQSAIQFLMDREPGNMKHIPVLASMRAVSASD